MTIKVQERTDYNPCAKVEVSLRAEILHLATLTIFNPTPCNPLVISITCSPYLGKQGHVICLFVFSFFAVTSEYSSAKSKTPCVPWLLLFHHSKQKHQSLLTIWWLILSDNFASYMTKHKLMHFRNKLMHHQREKFTISLLISHLNRQKHFTFFSGVILLKKVWHLHFIVLRCKYLFQ